MIECKKIYSNIKDSIFFLTQSKETALRTLSHSKIDCRRQVKNIGIGLINNPTYRPK